MCVWVFLCCKGVSPIVGDQMVWRYARRPFGDGRPLWLCRRLQLRAYAGLGAADPSRRDAEAALRPTPDQDPAPDHRRVLHQDNEVSIRLGDPPSPVPEPSPGLLLRHIDQRLNLTIATNPDARWLFPGRRGGQPMTPEALESRLRQH